MIEEVKTDKAQSAKGLLSQALIVGDLIFTAGFIHQKPNGDVVEGTVTEMFDQVITNIKEVLIASDSNLDKVVKVTLYVTDISILGELNQEYIKYFKDPLPVREAVCVKALPLGAQIEMSVIATM
jgi:2-iminobutanoate/2-iminopropanoate deaminase